MDPVLEAMIPQIEADTAGRLASLEADVVGVRAARAKLAEATQGKGAAVKLQEDRTIDGPAGPVPVRLFIPEGQVHGAYLHIHGGGWVLGSEKGQDPMLRGIAAGAGVAVVSVGYRLAPEHPYPAGLDDCMAAASWLEANAPALGVAGAARLALGGESAGGNLAAAVLLRRRDENRAPFRAAVLTYGVFSAVLDLPSMKAMWDRTLVLSGPIMEYFARSYVTDIDPAHPYVSPLYADLKGMPPAIFSVGTLDHLYSDTVLMAEKWQAAGNSCEVYEYEDGPHGFSMFPELEMARISNERIVEFVRAHIGAGANA